MQAYCSVCKEERKAFPVWWGTDCRESQWNDEVGHLVLRKVTKETQLEVKALAEKCKGQWGQVGAQRAAEKAAIKADNAAWMLEEQLAMMQMDDVTGDECVSLGSDEECALFNGY